VTRARKRGGYDLILEANSIVRHVVKAERSNIRQVPLSKFERLGTTEQVATRLFSRPA